MEEKIKELKEKFEGSNKYMLTLSYEDIKELFAIIEVLKNKEPIFLIKDLYDRKLKEIKLQDYKASMNIIERERNTMKLILQNNEIKSEEYKIVIKKLKKGE